MASIYAWGGITDAGYNREVNEDDIKVIDFADDVALFIIANGFGSKPSELQPAQLAINEVEQIIRRLYKENRDYLLDNSLICLREALMTANRVVGAFSLANEEIYSGFGTSMTCCFVHGKSFCFAHAGNTRLYLLRSHPVDNSTSINLLTRDHTVAISLLDDGVITNEQYHIHPERLRLTSGLGRFANPEFQTFEGSLKEKDMLLMTTSGIHFALPPDPIVKLIYESDGCESAVSNLVQASKMERYSDNMSAILVYLLPTGA